MYLYVKLTFKYIQYDVCSGIHAVAYVTCTIIIIVLTVVSEAFQINCKVPPESYLKDYHVVSCFVMHFEPMGVASVYLECEGNRRSINNAQNDWLSYHTLLSKQ